MLARLSEGRRVVYPWQSALMCPISIAWSRVRQNYSRTELWVQAKTSCWPITCDTWCSSSKENTFHSALILLKWRVVWLHSKWMPVHTSKTKLFILNCTTFGTWSRLLMVPYHSPKDLNQSKSWGHSLTRGKSSRARSLKTPLSVKSLTSLASTSRRFTSSRWDIMQVSPSSTKGLRQCECSQLKQLRSSQLMLTPRRMQASQ